MTHLVVHCWVETIDAKSVSEAASSLNPPLPTAPALPSLRLVDLCGNCDVLCGRSGITVGMVVDDDYAGGQLDDCGTEYLGGSHHAAFDFALVDDLMSYYVVLGVQEQNS